MSKNKVLHLFRILVYVGFLVEQKNGVHTSIVEVLCIGKLERESLHTHSLNAKSLLFMLPFPKQSLSGYQECAPPLYVL